MRELARRAGISHAWVSKVLAGQPAGWDFCAAVARAFGLSPLELFLLAGLITPAEIARAGSRLPLPEEVGQRLARTTAALAEADQWLLLRVAQALLHASEAAAEQAPLVHAEERLAWEIVQRFDALPPERQAEIERMIDEASRKATDDDPPTQQTVA